jgi:RHS repeat-associated protein
LNWLVFDDKYTLLPGKSGYKRLTSAPKEKGQDVAHERLFSPQITIDQAGYVYIYYSNEETTLLDVFFDDFKVDYVKSPVVQMDDYYPFGLAFNSYRAENSIENKIRFQGQEHVDDLNLGWDSFKLRNHQPEIGRFFNVDPLSEKYFYNSPYAFSENKVTSHVELEGLEAESIQPIKNKLVRDGEAAWNGLINNLKKGWDKVVEAVTPEKQIGKTEIEKINSTPIGVDEEQKEQVAPTGGDVDLGGTNPLYSKGGTAQGGQNGKVVMTQEGGQTEVSNPDNPANVKVDSIQLGGVVGPTRPDHKREIYSRVVVGEDTLDVYRYTRDNHTGATTKENQEKKK